MESLQFTAAMPEAALLDLPWKLPLEEWPEDILAALPRGISRHTVRFVKLGSRVLAVKETRDHFAFREYELLRRLGKLDVPCVDPVAVVTGRKDDEGEPLESCIITEHLPFSLPYRAVFSQSVRPDTSAKLIDAAAVLLVRLHLIGFYWGDVSLSNILFRRDAGGFAAYLVDAETGDIHPELTRGQREYDVDLARTNIIGELFDLEAGGLVDEDLDLIDVGDSLVDRYNELWATLTEVETYPADERWRVDERIRRLNDVGFDIEELSISQDLSGKVVKIQPKVVDAGHHARRLLRLTGLDVEDQQARRLLNDMDAWRLHMGMEKEPDQIVAHSWLIESFQPTIDAIPRDLHGKLAPAQLYHEILDHRWYRSVAEGRDIPMPEAALTYADEVLATRTDEEALLGTLPGDTELMALQMPIEEDTGELAAVAAIEAEDAKKLDLLRNSDVDLHDTTVMQAVTAAGKAAAQAIIADADADVDEYEEWSLPTAPVTPVRKSILPKQ